MKSAVDGKSSGSHTPANSHEPAAKSSAISIGNESGAARGLPDAGSYVRPSREATTVIGVSTADLIAALAYCLGVIEGKFPPTAKGNTKARECLENAMTGEQK